MLTINNTVVLDGSGFVRLYNENRPLIIISRIKYDLLPHVVDDNHITWLGYKINIKSTIYWDAKPSDIFNGFNLIVDSIKNEDIFESFFDIEIANYAGYLGGHDAYIVPSLEFLKLCYWFYMSYQIGKSKEKLLQIKKEILGKSQLLHKYSRASESHPAYEDLLNSTSDFCSELMFAVLTHRNGHDVSFNKNDDFIMDSGKAEVKSIHDKFRKEILDKDPGSILKMSLPDNSSYDDLKDIICNQITREKWKDHLNDAIKKKKPRIVLFNVTQSQALQPVSLFLEEKGTRKSFKEILDKCLSRINNNYCIPVLAALENIHEHHIMSFFCFLAPVDHKSGNPQLDLSRYNASYLKNDIFF